MTIIPFGEWLPDLPVFQNPGALIIKNVYPTGIGYNSFPSIGASSTALSTRAQGAYTAIDNTAAVNKIIFAGDVTKLYRLNAATFDNVSKPSTTYNVAPEDYWRFVQFGTLVIAVNINDNTQSYTIGTSSTFDDLTGNPPRARYIATIRDFVVTANTWDSVDLFQPKRVRWSPIGDPTASWAISAATQSDIQNLEGDGGQIQGIVGGEYGTIFQERSIWRMTYVGSPAIFQFDEVEKGRGALIPSSIVNVGRTVFYIAGDGFYMFDGVQSTPIGNNKVDKYFFNDIDPTYYSRVSAGVDPVNKLIMWAYPGAGSSAGSPNKILGYRWDLQKFFVAEINTQIVFSALTQGLTLEQLDTISTSIDALPYSLDSNSWTGGKVILAGFNSNNQLGYFDGTALDATLETGEFQAIPGRMSFIDTVRPIVDGGTVSVRMGTRNILTSDTVSYGSLQSPNTIGECEVRSTGRYHRVEATITGGFTNAQGVEIFPTDAGAR